MNNSLGDRIKRYENASRIYLTPRTPVIIRVDGKAFHTYTRGMSRPFSQQLMDGMVWAATHTAKQMQGFKLAYVQSDEATFFISDFDNLKTTAWFDNNKSKIVSVAASYMTAYFNRFMEPDKNSDKIAVFDGRAFNVPMEDVPNVFIWRMKDWERNSLQMFCRSIFSHKDLLDKNKTEMHEMLHKKGRNWATDLTPQQKNGTLILNKCFSALSDFIPSYEYIEQIIARRFQGEEENDLF